jgi:hypothetical protein
MGLFPKKPIKGKEKAGTLGPWPRPARVRVLGGRLGPTYPSRRCRPLPLAATLGALGRGQGCTPPPYIKRGPKRGEHNTSSTSPFSHGRPPPPPCAPASPSHHHLPSFSCMASRRAAHVGDHTTAARCRVVEFPDPYPVPSTSSIFARTGISGVIVITIHVQVHGGAACVALKSLLQDL